MMTRPVPAVFRIASRRSGQLLLLLTGLMTIGCAQSLSPRQMYDGPPLPKEQVGIIRSGCTEGSGLTIMTTQIDGKEVADGCADFALLPGEHQLELSAKQQSPKAEIPVTGSGMVFGRPTPMASRPEEGSRVVWASTSPLRITCSVRAGQEVIIVGSKGMGEDWQARCQEQSR
jgi:hypothetical protein